MASKSDATPAEKHEIRRLAREKARRERAALSVYRSLTEREQRAIDAWAHEKAKAQVLSLGVAIDGPRFGPPWGAFWSLVASKREACWAERLWNEHGREIRAELDKPELTHDWLNSDKIPAGAAGSVSDVTGQVGAMPVGLESRPRSSADAREAARAAEQEWPERRK